MRFTVNHNLSNATVVTYRYCILLLSIIGIAGLLHAQTPARVALNHPLNTSERVTAPVPRHGSSASSETLKVLVAMIAFQEDTEPRTSGNGSFDTSITTKKIIDPPPHNRQYVVNHMTFAENYFKKVSNGKLVVATTVLDNVYRLAGQMASYSPPRSSTNNLEIGKLMQDAWHLVDSLTPGLRFQDYNAFTILHAGVGRDVDLSSSLGFDPTPFDIPSIYVNLGALKKMFGSSYDGIPVDSGSYAITNSIIIPETESREVNTGLGISLLQLGVNGLIVASIGSHLGLPDLFDTKTGSTGIGRFGLMDGQSIFSWNGVFPPEPSAWEKYFLGWISPITVPPGEAVYSLPALSLNSNPDSVYRVPISAKEYFLVENRNRDANRDGATVTIERNGEIVQRTYFRDTTHFNAFDQDSIYGNIIDVDEFDWSLPGGVNSRTGEFFDGGLLIWHIDENVIDANYFADAVNANPDRRGVDLEEGDGSQDIGQTYGFISPGSGSEDGTSLDFWYSGNPATPRLLSNEFTPNSNPNSLSNDFANSHVYIKNFSVRGPQMTAKIQLGDDQVKMLTGFPVDIKGTLQNRALKVIDSAGIIVTTSRYIYGWRSSGDPIFTKGIIARAPLIGNGGVVFEGNVASADFNNDGTSDVGIAQNGFSTLSPPFQSLDGYSLKDANGDSVADQLFGTALDRRLTTSTVVSDSFIAVGAVSRSLYLLNYDGTIADSFQVGLYDTSTIVGVSLWQQPDLFIAVTSMGVVRIIYRRFIPDVVDSRNFSTPMNSPAVAGEISSAAGKGFVVCGTDGHVYLVNRSFSDFPGFPFSTGGEILNSAALADIDDDGSKDIIVFSGNKVWAINAAGSPLDNFPITAPTSKTMLTSPIIADLDGNGTPDIVGVTQEGLVVAYDKTGNMVRGFPILAGTNGGSTPAVFSMSAVGCLSCPIGIGLAVASNDGHVYAWQTGSISSLTGSGPLLPWPQYLHDAQNTGLDVSVPAGSHIPTFFPESRAYNWPNPVRATDNFKTHIRYYVASDAKVIVKIFDMAGDLVAELNGDGVGGLDNEIDWDVKNIQSGVYFAHIDAQGSGGSGSAVIKIAVVK